MTDVWCLRSGIGLVVRIKSPFAAIPRAALGISMRRLALAFLLSTLPTIAIAQDAAPLSPGASAIKGHVMFLASDAMKGREAGSPEYDIAAEYVSSQFFAAGLKPAGDKGAYLQQVPLVAYKPDGAGTLSVTRGGAATPLAAGTDFIVSPNARAKETNLAAPVVFVGYGIVAERYGRDDFAGLDVKG
jgi:hypothetical protein